MGLILCLDLSLRWRAWMKTRDGSSALLRPGAA